MLTAEGDRTITCTVRTRTALSPAWRTASSSDRPVVGLQGWDRSQAVSEGRSNQTGTSDAVGQTRNPDLTDDSTAFEVLTELTPGHSFAYETTEFTDVLGELTEGVHGEWTFTPDGNSTVIRWTYEFKPLPGRRWLIKWS